MINRESFRPTFVDFSLLSATAILISLFTSLATAALGFWLGASISALPMLVGLLTAILVVLWGARKFFYSQRWLAAGLQLLLLVGIFLPSWYISRKVYDTSSDGQAYHAAGILHLVQGWNPVYNEPVSSETNFQEQYVNDYPKGAWIQAASLIKITGDFEDGKLFNFFLLAAGCFLSFSALLGIQGLSLEAAIILAFLIGVNPVSFLQLISYYVDGQVFSLVIAMMATMVLWGKRRERFLLVLLAAIIILIVNLKTTGLALTVTIGGAIALYLFVKTRLKSLPVVFAASIPVAMLVIGYNPYVTNTLRHGNPFYPITGTSLKENPVIYYQTPLNFRDKSAPERLAISLFSRSQYGVEPTQLKIPFTIQTDELLLYKVADVRVEGFGPFFSGTLLLGVVLLVWIWIVQLPGRFVGSGLFLVFVLSSLINPAGWWARFAPQTWLLPILPVGMILAFRKSRGGGRFLAWLIAVILALNMVLIAIVYIPGQLDDSFLVNEQLTAIRARSYRQPVTVNFSVYTFPKIRFDEWKIRYREVAEISDCSKLTQIYFSLAEVCIKPAGGN
jgi:hypothetical protein